MGGRGTEEVGGTLVWEEEEEAVRKINRQRESYRLLGRITLTEQGRVYCPDPAFRRGKGSTDYNYY